MKKIKSCLAIILTILMLLMATPFTASAKDIVTGDYSGKTVIIHSNDVHGSILNYAKLQLLAFLHLHSALAFLQY